MFTVLIEQIKHFDKSSIHSNCVGQVNVTNEITQFSEQKLNDENRCEWFFNAIAPATSVLKQCDAVDHVLLSYVFRLQSYTF